MIHKLLKRPQAIIGLCLIAIVIVIAIAAPAFSPHDPELVNLSQKYAQPDAEYPLGTDQLGRCTLSRLLYRKMSGGTEFLSGYSAALQKMSAATVEYVRGMQIIKIFGVTVQYYKTLIKLRDISESFQNAIELNQEIKSYGLKEKVEAQMDQQLDESENLQWKAQITQTIPVTIGQTLSILPIGITATVGLSMLASGQVSILILLGYLHCMLRLHTRTVSA